MSEAKKILSGLNENSKQVVGNIMVAVVVDAHGPYEIGDLEQILSDALDTEIETKEATIRLSYMPTTFEPEDYKSPVPGGDIGWPKDWRKVQP